MNTPSPQANPAPAGHRQVPDTGTRPEVSVLLFGASEAAIEDSVKTLAAQSLRPLEVLVFDGNDPAKAPTPNGDYIQFLNTTDLIALTKLESQAHAMEKNGADIACGPWIEFAADASRRIRKNRVFGNQPVANCQALLDEYICNWSLPIQACLFRRTFLEERRIPLSEIFPQQIPETFARLFLGNPKVLFMANSLALHGTDSSEKNRNVSLDFQARFLATLLKERRDDSILSPDFRTRVIETLWKMRPGPENIDTVRTLREEVDSDPASRLYRLNAMRRGHGRKQSHSPITNCQIRQIEELGFVLS